MSWTAPTDFTTVCRRAGGRRRYNAQRAAARQQRLAEVSRLLHVLGLPGRGRGAWIAGILGVSRATICRDLAEIDRQSGEPQQDPYMAALRARMFRALGRTGPPPALGQGDEDAQGDEDVSTLIDQPADERLSDDLLSDDLGPFAASELGSATAEAGERVTIMLPDNGRDAPAEMARSA